MTEKRFRLVTPRSSWRVTLPGAHDFEAILHALVDHGWTVRRQEPGGLTATKGHHIPLAPLFAYKGTPRRLSITDKGDDGLVVEIGISAFMALGTKRHVEWLCELDTILPGLVGCLKSSPVSVRMFVWAQLQQLPFCVALAFTLAVALKVFIAQPFVVPDPGMSPTIPAGGRVIIYKGPGKQRFMHTGSIIVRQEGDHVRVGRVVAEGPAEVRIENGHTIVDGRLLKEPYATFSSVNWDLAPSKTQLVTALDLRDSFQAFTLIEQSDVVGVAIALYYPPGQACTLLNTVDVR